MRERPHGQRRLGRVTIGYQYAQQGRSITGGGAAIPSYLQGRDQRLSFNFAYYFRRKGERFE